MNLKSLKLDVPNTAEVEVSEQQPAASLTPQFKNLFALCYLFAIYGLGVFLLIGPEWLLNGLGMGLIIHALVLSAAFTHEFIHGNIFKSRQLNAFWGQAMTHLNGACTATWEQLANHHLNHHIHHVDFIPFDYPSYIQQLPIPVRRVLFALEWAYIPVFELILRWHVCTAPFREADKQRLQGRTIIVIAYRLGLFALLGYLSVKALLLYAIAYIGFVAAMRQVDTFHHTYDYVIQGQPVEKRDRVYEQENTFSNVVSIHYPWLNLLYLNFGYHNAHHHNMRCPWHELPQLHRQLYGEATNNLLTIGQGLPNYHHFRLARLQSGQGDSPSEQSFGLENFTGAVGVSFLTPP